jgi:PAS domain S-box-containing protein
MINRKLLFGLQVSLLALLYTFASWLGSQLAGQSITSVLTPPLTLSIVTLCISIAIAAFLQIYLLTIVGQKQKSKDRELASALALQNTLSKLKAANEDAEIANCVVHNAREGVLVTDANGIILSVNPAFTEISGFSALEAIGKTPRILKSDRHDPAFYVDMWSTLATAGYWQGEIWNRRKSGERYLEHKSITMIPDEQGHPFRYVAVFNDITEMYSKDLRIQHMAFMDPVTGLPNRSLTIQRLVHAINQHHREGRIMAVIFLDLDHFKDINDSLGHAVGDSLLLTISNRIASVVRQTDTVSRLGGDEFIILLYLWTSREPSHRLDVRWASLFSPRTARPQTSL